VAPRERSPPRWLLNTFSALAEAAFSGWLKLTVSGALRAAARALAIGRTLVITGAWAQAAPAGASSKAAQRACWVEK
jgi:hypothetical protein